MGNPSIYALPIALFCSLIIFVLCLIISNIVANRVKKKFWQKRLGELNVNKARDEKEKN